MATITKIKGSEKQISWARAIIKSWRDKGLTARHEDALLRFAGPDMAAQGVVYSPIIIDHRDDLIKYAESLEKFLEKTPQEKREIAEQAGAMLRGIAKSHI